MRVDGGDEGGGEGTGGHGSGRDWRLGGEERGGWMELGGRGWVGDVGMDWLSRLRVGRLTTARGGFAGGVVAWGVVGVVVCDGGDGCVVVIWGRYA